MTRMVWIKPDNIQAEVISEQLHGALVKYRKGGFEITEYLSDEDYNYMEDDEE